MPSSRQQGLNLSGQLASDRLHTLATLLDSVWCLKAFLLFVKCTATIIPVGKANVCYSIMYLRK